VRKVVVVDLCGSPSSYSATRLDRRIVVGHFTMAGGNCVVIGVTMSSASVVTFVIVYMQPVRRNVVALQA
jgi:hypothetical protein